LPQIVDVGFRVGAVETEFLIPRCEWQREGVDSSKEAGRCFGYKSVQVLEHH
jgi:hypothetical protein